MNDREIKISVLMPAYNAAAFIAEAIASVLAQTFSHFELIIINDGSTDDTAGVVASFTDARIVWLQQEHAGIAAALNNGLQYAKADYIARFDADDICYSYRLQKQYDFITHHPEYIIVGSSADYVDQYGAYIFTYHPPAFADADIQQIKQRTCPFIHSSVLYKKDIVIQQGGYNTYAHTFEDHLLWLTILNEGKAYNIKQPLLKVRLNPQSITIDEQWHTKAFTVIKNKVLKQYAITQKEGMQLLHILKSQDSKRIKEGAYYSLLAKKYLWNNYQPNRARQNLKKVIAANKLDWKSCLFFLLSFLPERLVQKTYKLLKAK